MPLQMNADLRWSVYQDYGQRSDRAAVSRRNKTRHDDAVTKQDQFIERWRAQLVDRRPAYKSKGLARIIKNKTLDLRTEETIAKVVQKARKRMLAGAIPAASSKLTR
jgi:hypothetical protein